MAVTNFQNLTIAHPGAVKTLSTATTVRPAALSEVMFRVNRQAVQPASTELSATPLLSDGQEAQLKATPTVPTQGPAATQSVKDNMRPLATWLADPETALIRCALDRLSIKVPATAATGVQLFPLSGDPQATLINLPGHDEPLPLQVEPFDPTGNALILSLPFPDTALYEAVITAMQTYESAARITLTYTHPYAVMVTPPSHGVGFYHLNETVTAKPAFMAASLKTTTFGHSTTPVQPIHPIPHTTTPEPPQQPQRQERSVTLQFTFPIYRSLDSQPDPYPNFPKPSDATVWHPWVDQDNANLSVFFKPSDSPDQFFYLPTAYKLGFFADEQGGLQPPISAQSYIKDDEYRVKVKLVALPYIDDDVREKVRANICSQVLKGALPFVQLIPAAGVACEFASSIVPVSDSSTSGQTLPASIQFIAGDDLAPDKLTFEFDMNAFDYALFGEILKHGIKGTLVVRDGKKFQQDIEVSMKLSDGEVIANSLVPNVELDTANNAATVTLTNRLDFPVELESARAFFTKYASLIPGMVFKSEPCLFLPAPDQPSSHFDEKGKDQACMVLPLTPSKEFKDWNRVGIALGTAIAKAGSAEDWLNRVNQDPSIQPQHFKIHIDLIVPDAAKQVIQAIQLKLYRDGDPAPHKDPLLLPSATAADLIVEMTLVELMGTDGKHASFSLEYYNIYQDGSLGLPQRLALDPSLGSLVLAALMETAVSQYTLVYNDETGEHRISGDRASTEPALDKLRDAGSHWRLFAHAPAPTDPPPVAPADPGGA